jgi:hypothetical protein
LGCKRSRHTGTSRARTSSRCTSCSTRSPSTPGGHVDALAERITALGGTARGTVRTVAARSSLKPYPENIHTGAQHLEALAIALSTAAKASRQAIEIADDLDDEVTADLFNEITGALDRICGSSRRTCSDRRGETG